MRPRRLWKRALSPLLPIVIPFLQAGWNEVPEYAAETMPPKPIAATLGSIRFALSAALSVLFLKALLGPNLYVLLVRRF